MELKELGPVTGKTLLHLQCHIGLDTISWARQGAICTGIDFSSGSIRAARRLANDLNIATRFLVSDVYDLPVKLHDEFDIVFTSYGAICWLPDLPRWATIISRFLKQEGFFYIVDFHPIFQALDQSADAKELRLQHPYFNHGNPIVWSDDGTYASPHAHLENRTCYTFQHHLGEIVTALLNAGLDLHWLHEFPFISYQAMPFMVPDGNGNFRLPNDELPLQFSIKAGKSP